MARAARRAHHQDENYDDIIAWYERELAKPAPPAEKYLYPPVTLGRTWDVGPDGLWVLPERSLGWEILGWCGLWLKHSETGEPWQFTFEQARLLLWWYEVDERGRFVYRDGIIQRLKGWGKDPFGACLCAAEMLGPVRFSGRWRPNGQPLGVDCPDAWVQTCGVALDQTKNTMRLFPGLFTDKAIKKYGIQIGRTMVHAMGDRRLIEAITSSPTKLEGARGSFQLLNETHHWKENNDGLEMAAVMSRNAAKSKDGAARSLRITNAPAPEVESVGLNDREAFELALEGSSGTTGIMYDSLEAPPEAPLTAEAAPHVLRAVRGDSYWLDIERLVAEILDTRNPPSQNRRFYYNQLVAAEESWLVPQEFDALARPDIVVDPKDAVVIFFDGSKSDDATAIIGCRLSDGHVFTLGMWQRPPGSRGDEWTVPRYAVDQRVDEIMSTYNVVGFWGDPSHTLDDVTQERYWDGLFDDWHRRYKTKLQLWAQPNKHAVMWDMTNSQRVAEFTAAAERCVAEIELAAKAVTAGDAPTFTHDGDGRLRRHAHNAQRYPNKWGVSLWKGHRESKRKIDLAVCMVGARMLRRAVLNAEPERKRSGRVRGFRY